MTIDFFSRTTLFLISALLLPPLLFLLKTRRHRRRRLHYPPSPPSLPIIGHLHLLGTIIHRTLHDLSSRYGPIMYLQLGYVPCVVASSPEFASELLKTNELSFLSRKQSLAIDYLTYNAAFAFAPAGPYWKFIKKLSVSELLSGKSLNNYQAIRTQELNRFLRGLINKSKLSQAVNVTDEFLKLSNNIISRMMISSKHSMSETDSAAIRTLVREVTLIFGEFNSSDFIWFCKNLDLQGFRKRFKDIRRRYDALSEKIITEHEQARMKKRNNGDGGEDLKDFVDLLLDLMEDESSDLTITRDHVKALVLDFFTAGTDTTAVAMEWALAELMNNPRVLKKAREEVERIVGMDRLVSELDVPNLPYIVSVVKETFRIHPPIPLVARRSTEACRVGEYDIPENTLLFVNVWTIGRDPKNWENPLEFRPERFLEGKGNMMDVRGTNFELLPFGTGRRGCVGVSYVMQQLPTVVAAMIQCFDWKLADANGVEMSSDTLVDMSERAGLAAPRAHDLTCIPVARVSPFIVDES